MNFVEISKAGEVAFVTLARGKVNALNEPMVAQIRQVFEDLEKDPGVKAVVLTGRGKFFSFGFDVPEFMTYPKSRFIDFLNGFTELYRYLFMFSKPVVAAVNGHAVAGGCMLAATSDHRVMVAGKAKISLNEITFGASVFSVIVEIIKFCVGQRNAETLLVSGAMYSAEQARELGLIDRVTTQEQLKPAAEAIAVELARKNPAAFKSIKRLLRKPVVDQSINGENDSINVFADIWYSKDTRDELRNIKIHN